MADERQGSSEESDSDDQIELQGILHKWTNYIHGWQDRYIVLKNGTLSYYKSEQESGYGCRGALSLAKAVIKPHEFDECRFDVAVNDCVWYLRADSVEVKQHWVDALESYKAESGYGTGSEYSLKRHGSTVSLQSNTYSTASGSSFRLSSRNLQEKLAEMETYKDILCRQIDTLQQYFDSCADNNETPHKNVSAIDFKGEAITFRTTTAAVLDTLSHCADLVLQREETWKKKLERETGRRKRCESLCKVYFEQLQKTCPHPGPELEEGPHSVLADDEFYDAIESGLDKMEEEQELRERLKTGVVVPPSPPVVSPAAHHPLWPEIESTVKQQVAMAKLGVGECGKGWQLFAEDGEMRMYRREEEVDGMVVDPLKAVHNVKGITGHELCHYFFSPQYRYDWETTLEQMTVLDTISDDTLLFHQLHKRIWPASQRDVIFWSHMRRLQNDMDEEGPDIWTVVNNSTEHVDYPANAGKCVRIYLTVCLMCQTRIDPPKDGAPITRDGISSKITYCSVETSKSNPALWKQLDTAERNSICCSRHMRCCHQPPSSPKLSIKATFARCPNTDCEDTTLTRHLTRRVSTQRAEDITRFQGFDADEPLKQSEITDCRRKLVVTMKMVNRGESNGKNEFIVVDHVYDAEIGKNVRLFNPYVIKVKQSVVSQVLKLRFRYVVNAEASEVVYNKHDGNYTGCDVESKKPTCGVFKYKGEKIPYSEGFCCSCDRDVNNKRQPETDVEDKHVLYTDPEYIDLETTANRETYGNDVHKKNPREVFSSSIQIRGGQNCADRYTPRHYNPETYQESTHCLRFSDLWYNVYSFTEDTLNHTLHVQIFEKHEDENGATHWIDLTQGQIIQIGKSNTRYKNSSIALRYHHINSTSTMTALDSKNHRILIPENGGKFIETRGGPPEYLVVGADQVSSDGDQCDVAGVGFEAFAKQPNRCAVPKGSCLSNQPKSLWLHDKLAERRGEKGCFFLKHYGNLTEEPIIGIHNSKDIYLSLKYTEPYVSIIDMEVKADFNAILRPNSNVKITEVYIDSTSPSRTHLIIKLTNSGLISSTFSVTLADCPRDVPTTFNDIKSQPFHIPPQTQHVFSLDIPEALPAERFHCSIHALNVRGELVALRRIRIQKFDRCVCTWHCLCACVGSEEGLQCLPMSLEHYHAAGFEGSLPVATSFVEYSLLEDLIAWSFYFGVFLSLTLLILGATKGIIGVCCCEAVGAWGLDTLLDLPRKMRGYNERELRGRAVRYDEDGWPIHPDSKKRVRNVSKTTEFCVNFLFFFAFPMVVCGMVTKRICCPDYGYKESKASQLRPLKKRRKCNASKGTSIDTIDACMCGFLLQEDDATVQTSFKFSGDEKCYGAHKIIFRIHCERTD